MQIRDATDDDWTAIWPFFEEIVRHGETYAYPPQVSTDEGRSLWMLRSPGRTVVALDDDGVVIGTANMTANRPGAGSHIATASFMVSPEAADRGVGRALGEEVIEWASEQSFRAIQFNAVVETNERAVALWLSLGFEIIGTVPEAFRRPSGEYVGLHVMYRRL